MRRRAFGPALAMALMLGGLGAGRAAAQEVTTIAQSGEAVFPGSPVYRTVRLAGVTFGLGGGVSADGSGFGAFTFRLSGVTVSGGQPRTLLYGGSIEGGTVSASGVVTVSGHGDLDPGDGSPAVTGIPFLLAVTPDSDDMGTLAFTLEAVNLGAAVVSPGAILSSACAPRELAPRVTFLDGQTLGWPAVPGATGYDVYRGTIDGGAWSFDHTCFAPAVAVTSTSDPAVPSAGRGFYYLVVVRNACGRGSLGVASGGSQVPNPTPCP